jgi:hypothetical protein
MSVIRRTFDGLAVGPVKQAENLSVFPLLVARDRAPSYLTLGEAIAGGLARVGEVSEGGSVPTLRVENQAARPVLIMDGEELVGARQNRVVNLTILVPAQATLDIPVSCVEAGRWGGHTRHFAAAPRAHYAAGRAMKVAQVNAACAVGERHADQGAIWADIAEKSARLGALSHTSAMDAMFEHAADQLREFEARLAPGEREVGAMFAIDGRVVGLDLFDCGATWRTLMPKLAHSYGLEALDRLYSREHADAGPRGRRHRAPDARAFLLAVSRAEWAEFPAVGLGRDLRLTTAHLAGGALEYEGQVLHLVAFAQ